MLAAEPESVADARRVSVPAAEAAGAAEHADVAAAASGGGAARQLRLLQVPERLGAVGVEVISTAAAARAAQHVDVAVLFAAVGILRLEHGGAVSLGALSSAAQ